MTRTIARLVTAGLLIAVPAAGFAAPPELDGPPPRLEAALAELGVDDDQRLTLRGIVTEAVDELRAIRSEAHEIRAGIRDALTAEEIDRVVIEELRVQAVGLFDHGTAIALDAMADAAEVLTPEQRVAVGERMEERRRMWEARKEAFRAHLDRPEL